MNGREELVERLALHRRERLGEMSPSAFDELVRTVRENPAPFVEDRADEAFSLIVAACERYRRAAEEEEYLDEPTYLAARARRLARLGEASEKALAVDEGCADARLCHILARDLDPDQRLDALLEHDAALDDLQGALVPVPDGDIWDDVFCHGRLRLRLALALACLDSGRYRMALEAGERVLELSPRDVVGAGHVCMLALARLEDEEGFDAMDARLGRRGDSWAHLGRVLLLYKLGRTAAARRALMGFSRLVEGGAYALLRPVLVDTYVPDRPPTTSCGFDEATLAVYEADPIIADIPDFAPWVESVPEVARSARSFAERNGYDW